MVGIAFQWVIACQLDIRHFSDFDPICDRLNSIVQKPIVILFGIIINRDRL